jgi:hypothetical protein
MSQALMATAPMSSLVTSSSLSPSYTAPVMISSPSRYMPPNYLRLSSPSLPSLSVPSSIPTSTQSSPTRFDTTNPSARRSLTFGTHSSSASPSQPSPSSYVEGMPITNSPSAPSFQVNIVPMSSRPVARHNIGTAASPRLITSPAPFAGDSLTDMPSSRAANKGSSIAPTNINQNRSSKPSSQLGDSIAINSDVNHNNTKYHIKGQVRVRPSSSSPSLSSSRGRSKSKSISPPRRQRITTTPYGHHPSTTNGYGSPPSVASTASLELDDEQLQQLVDRLRDRLHVIRDDYHHNEHRTTHSRPLRVSSSQSMDHIPSGKRRPLSSYGDTSSRGTKSHGRVSRRKHDTNGIPSSTSTKVPRRRRSSSSSSRRRRSNNDSMKETSDRLSRARRDYGVNGQNSDVGIAADTIFASSLRRSPTRRPIPLVRSSSSPTRHYDPTVAWPVSSSNDSYPSSASSLPRSHSIANLNGSRGRSPVAQSLSSSLPSSRSGSRSSSRRSSRSRGRSRVDPPPQPLTSSQQQQQQPPWRPPSGSSISPRRHHRAASPDDRAAGTPSHIDDKPAASSSIHVATGVCKCGCHSLSQSIGSRPRPPTPLIDYNYMNNSNRTSKIGKQPVVMPSDHNSVAIALASGHTNDTINTDIHDIDDHQYNVASSPRYKQQSRVLSKRFRRAKQLWHAHRTT